MGDATQPWNEGDLPRAMGREAIQRFGEPDTIRRFGDGQPRPGLEGHPKLIDVLVWRAVDDEDISTFLTCGMSSRAMPGSGERAELMFSVRRQLPEAIENQLCAFMANLACYPFDHGLALDWWHMVGNPGLIPCFSEGMSLILHPRFIEDGWDRLESASGEILVKLLHIIPIPQSERQLVREQGLGALLDLWVEMDLDVLEPR